MIRRVGALVVSATTTLTLALTLTLAPAQAAEPRRPTNFLVVATTPATLGTAMVAARNFGADVLTTWPEIGVAVVSANRTDLASRLRQQPGIDSVGATRNLVGVVKQTQQNVDDDPVFGPLGPATLGGDDASEPDSDRQWNLRMIGADVAHRVTDGSRQVTVGILDSGVDATHPDLAANLDPAQSVGCTSDGVADTRPDAWLPGNSGHGTHVAGIVGAARNGSGMVGVAPGVRLASIKVVDDQGFIYPEYVVCGMMWAADRQMAVTNNSYLVDPWNRWCGDDPDQAAVLTALRRALAWSEQQQVVTVASAGNGGEDLAAATTDSTSPTNGTSQQRRTGADCLAVPSGLPNVVTVSAVGPTRVKAYYSNYGAGAITVTAPGGDGWRDWSAETPRQGDTIWSTLPGGRYGWLQGTSMAAPHVAGVVALMRSVHPTWSAAQVRLALQQQSRALSCPGGYDYNGDGRPDAVCTGPAGQGFYGAGLVDAAAAVR